MLFFRLPTQLIPLRNSQNQEVENFPADLAAIDALGAVQLNQLGSFWEHTVNQLSATLTSVNAISRTLSGLFSHSKRSWLCPSFCVEQRSETGTDYKADKAIIPRQPAIPTTQRPTNNHRNSITNLPFICQTSLNIQKYSVPIVKPEVYVVGRILRQNRAKTFLIRQICQDTN